MVSATTTRAPARGRVVFARGASAPAPAATASAPTRRTASSAASTTAPASSRAALRALNLLEDLAGGRCTGHAEAVGERPPPHDRPATGPRRGPARRRRSRCRGPRDPPQASRSRRRPRPADLALRAPTHRPDLQREVDLIEELMRHHGLEHIRPASFCVPREARPPRPRPDDRRADRLADGLQRGRLHEIVSLAFVAEDKLAHFHDDVPADRRVRVANPMRGADVMRTHLLPGLLDALAHNTARHGRPVRLFELGRTYAWPEGTGPSARRLPEGTRDVDVRCRASARSPACSARRPRPRRSARAHRRRRPRARPASASACTCPKGQIRVGWLHPGVQVRLARRRRSTSAWPARSTPT
jgi:phenylalanyl-tRNA synthetase beta chain